MSPIEWLYTILGLWAIAALIVLAFFAALPPEPPRCARKYRAPGDEVYRSYRQWGGKGRRF